MDYLPNNIVFDTGAFLAGLQNYYYRVYTTPLVLDEVKDYRSRELLAIAINAGKVIIKEPSKWSYEKVNQIVRKISAFNLSKTDISLASLAYELKPCIVFTDDLTLQNLLLNLDIRYKSIKLNININHKKEYKYICTGCNREFKKYYNVCPYCGNQIKILSKNTDKY